MPRLAIVAALEREVRSLVKGWRVTEKEYDSRRFRFFENGDVVLVCGGIGAAAARRATEAVISIFDPKVICSVGFAGALDAKLKVGDVIRPGVVVNAGDASKVLIEGGDGVLVSFEAVANPAQKAKLRDAFGAHIIDMEAAAVARSAQARGKEFRVVKTISDEMDFEFPAMEPFVDAEGKFSEGRFAWYAAVRPWLWLRVIRMGWNSMQASTALCAALGNSREISGPPERSS